MRLLTKSWAVAYLVVAVLTGVGGAVAAQGDDRPPPNELSGGKDVTLSPKEMLDKARTMVPEMLKARVAVGAQLAEARKKKDVVKTLCLDDKVKQMKLATDTAQARVVDLTSSVSQNDPDRSKHEFTVIQALRERVQTLVAEAQQCIGEETGFIGNDDVTLEIDPAVPDADPSDFPDDPLVSEPPVLSSPTL